MRQSTASWNFNAKGVIDGLRAVAENPVELARPAAYAAAKTFYDQAVVNAAAVSPGENGTGRLADAIYHVWSADNATDSKAVYHISWNKTSKGKGAPHGYLIEFGYNRRYQAIKLRNGSWITLRAPHPPRPVGASKATLAAWEASKERWKNWQKPTRSASQAEKDAYWMPRKDGPTYHLGRFFLRNAYNTAFQQALEAAQQELATQVRNRMMGRT